MKPIDADAIDKRYVPIAPVLCGDDVHYEWVAFIEDINKLPTVDAVPVIRCKDCSFWDKEPSQTAMPEIHTCRYWRIGTTSVDYCAWATPKETEHD